MRVFIGVLLMIIGVALGLYIGLWWSLAGGIIDIVHMVQTHTITGGMMAWDIVKILLCETFGVLAAFIPWSVGGMVMASA